MAGAHQKLEHAEHAAQAIVRLDAAEPPAPVGGRVAIALVAVPLEVDLCGVCSGRNRLAGRPPHPCARKSGSRFGIARPEHDHLGWGGGGWFMDSAL